MSVAKIVRDLVIVAVLIIIAVFLFGVGVGERTIRNDEAVSELAQTFQDELILRAVDAMNGVMPIEGYDATMLMDVFPEFEPRDFDGVETVDGVYAYEQGALSFEDRDPAMQTSATLSVTGRGFETLLQNVAARFDIALDSRDAVMTILDRLTEVDTFSGSLPFGMGQIAGTVMVGPQCPVQREGEACPDRPLRGVIAILVDDPEQELISRLETDADGAFSVLVEPASYVVHVESEGTFPVCEDVVVEVIAGERENIEIVCDSGIR